MISVSSLKRKFYGSLASPRRVYHEAVEANVTSNSSILDIGCGYEAPDLENLPQCHIKVGLDLETFRAIPGSTVRFVNGDCCALPFAREAFDLVTCRSVLEHVWDPFSLFDEISRVLRPEGAFVFLTPNRWDYVSLASSMIPNRFHPKLVQWMTGREEADTFPTLYRANGTKRLRALANHAGLKVDRMDWIREHPHYLKFSVPTYLAGIMIEQIVQRPIRASRPWILGKFRKPHHSGTNR